MNREILEQIGLTKYESAVYLAIAKLGTTKTGPILKESMINTGKIYEILESLKNKGLVSESEINNVRHFTAGPATNLIEYLAQKKNALQKQEILAKEAVKYINSLSSQANPKIRTVVYTGYRGFTTAVNEATLSLEKNDEILAMGVRSRKDEKFSRFWDNWTNKIMKTRKQRVLFSEKGEHFKSLKEAINTKTRYIESITPATVDIFGNKAVLIFHYDEPINVIVIYDLRTAKSFKTFFEQLWKQAKD